MNTSHPAKPAILTVSSHVVRGSIGNRAAVLALEAMGFPVWAVPTVVLPWHPGHAPCGRFSASDQEFKQLLDDIRISQWSVELGGILTGYMANVEQVLQTAQLIRFLREQKSDIKYVCDPVLGDAERLYIDQDIACAIRDELLPLCDIATPNRFELGWLAGVETPQTVEAILAVSRTLDPNCLFVTSCPGDGPGEIGNLYLDDMKILLASHKTIYDPPKGTGDLTAALFIGHLMDGEDAKSALKNTTSSVYQVLQHSALWGGDEMVLERDIVGWLNVTEQVAVKEIKETP